MIARCLTEPRYLESLISKQRDPAILLELRRMRLFGAFISKVQHNHLWDSFPATRQLMQRFGIEFDLFLAYRMENLNDRPHRIHREAKITRFVRFLDRTLTRSRYRRFSLLADVFRHERNIWELSSEKCWSLSPNDNKEGNTSPDRDLGAMKWPTFRELIPDFRGHFRLEQFGHNPLRTIASLRATPSSPTRRRRSSFTLAYWKLTDSHPSVLKLDVYQGAILSNINGTRRIREIIERVRTGELRQAAPLQFRGFFEQAKEAGLISLF